MLPSAHRLRRSREIARVQRSRIRRRGALFTIRLWDRRDDDPTRFAIHVSRRVSRKATERNRIARVVRSLVSEMLPAVRPGADVLIVPHGVFSAYRERRALGADLRTLFSHTNLLRP
jgi:ribonuclease P protein component